MFFILYTTIPMDKKLSYLRVAPAFRFEKANARRKLVEIASSMQLLFALKQLILPLPRSSSTAFYLHLMPIF
jgi:hypothetical protein